MWWFGRKYLPKATGPYVPGCMDVMLDYSIKGLFAAFYYPTNETSYDKLDFKRCPRWLPEDNYFLGIAKTLLIYPIFLRIPMWFYSFFNTYIPALYGEKVKTDTKLQCVIFSHGLGGHRFLYSNIFCELASRGYLVVALEHRDQSACYTYYYQNETNARNDIKTSIEHRTVGLQKTHYAERNKQVNHRADECSRMLDVIINLNKGEIPANIMDIVPSKQGNGFKFQDLVGNIDTDNITMIGHSFGGATALLSMSKRPELKQGILLDPWMFPVKGEGLPEMLKQPLLFINTETFHVVPNVKAMEKYLDKKDAEMCTILHTTHEHQSDTALIAGSWLNWFMKKLHPAKALKINNFLILRFLNKHTGFPSDIKPVEIYLKQESQDYEKGLTKPWA